MTILHISGAKTWRGGEQQLFYLFEELQSIHINQYVYCPTHSELSKRLSNSHEKSLITYNKNSSISILSAFQLKKICKQYAIDIIHVHDAHAHNMAFLAAFVFKNKTPLIVSRRVDFPIGKNFLSYLKYNHKSISSIICVSEAIKQIMCKDIKEQTKLTVAHSGIDTTRFPYQNKTGILRKELGVDESTLIIGNTSALAPHKDYFTFIDTAELLLKKTNNIHFVIIGSGPLQNEIGSYIDKKDLNQFITLIGFKTNIHELLPDFDIFLITSKTEGLGTSILDAFACSVPVVATNAGGINEIIENEKNGLLAPVGNAEVLSINVLKLLNNSVLRKGIVENAKKKLQYFDKKNTAQQTLTVYQKTIANTNC